MAERIPTVLHADLDAFFAAVEQLDDPSLVGRPVIVGGTGPRAVVATASYEARRYGVGSAMPLARALAACRDAVVVAPRMARYRELSRQVFDVFARHADVVEAVSLDEAYLDVAARVTATADVVALAARLRADVAAATGLTVSVGAGTTKLVAKLASDFDKPDGLTIVAERDTRSFLDRTPVAAVWGIGPKTAETLDVLGVTTVADLRELDLDLLAATFGPRRGQLLYDLARNVDERPVAPREPRKQLGAEHTFDRDITDVDVLAAELDRLAAAVAVRLAGDGRAGRTVTVKVRTAAFTTTTRAVTLPHPTADADTIAAAARDILAADRPSQPIRLLGVTVSNLAASTAGPVTVQPTFDFDAARWQPGDRVVDARLGAGTVAAVGAGPGRVKVVFDRLPAGALDVSEARLQGQGG